MKKPKISVELYSNEGFFIGDYCYGLANEYKEIIYKSENSLKEGLNKVMSEDSSLCFALAHTYEGDGSFLDQNGNDYPVDTGSLSLIPLEIVKFGKYRKGFNPGLVIKSPGKAIFESENGLFDITFSDGKKVIIDTEFSYGDFIFESEYDEEGFLREKPRRSHPDDDE